MTGKSFIGLAAFVCTTTLISCAVSGSESHHQSTKFPEGRELYLSKCTGCHRAYEREMHTADKWKAILDEMTIKAKLISEEKNLILNYLSEVN